MQPASPTVYAPRGTSERWRTARRTSHIFIVVCGNGKDARKALLPSMFSAGFRLQLVRCPNALNPKLALPAKDHVKVGNPQP